MVRALHSPPQSNGETDDSDSSRPGNVLLSIDCEARSRRRRRNPRIFVLYLGISTDNRGNSDPHRTSNLAILAPRSCSSDGRLRPTITGCQSDDEIGSPPPGYSTPPAKDGPPQLWQATGDARVCRQRETPNFFDSLGPKGLPGTAPREAPASHPTTPGTPCRSCISLAAAACPA